MHNRLPDAKVQFWMNFEDMTEGLEGNDIVLLGDFNVSTLRSTDHNLREPTRLLFFFSLVTL